MGKGKSTLGNIIFMKEEDDVIPTEVDEPEKQVFKAAYQATACTQYPKAYKSKSTGLNGGKPL